MGNANCTGKAQAPLPLAAVTELSPMAKTVIKKDNETDWKYLDFKGLNREERNNLSDANVIHILTHHVDPTRVAIMSLDDCPLISDDLLEYIGTHCKELRALIVNGTNVTNRGIESIMGNCKELMSLSFGNCKGVTNAVLNIVATHATGSTQIQYLHTER